MRRFKNWVIGGIENKVFNLILITVLLLTGAYMAVSLHHSNMLSSLSAQSSQRQEEAIEEITGSVMDSVVADSMNRSTRLEARIADELFKGLKTRVEMLERYTRQLLCHPEDYPRMEYSAPDPALNGLVKAQTILADGVDPEDAALCDKLSLLSNMSDMMEALFGASEETNSCFVALPEGAFLVTDDRSATKFDGTGAQVSYDPRTRPWYKQAVRKGELIFTDVEVDAFTGDIGVVCAMPVYVDGELAAVVGTDLFLTSMQNSVQSSEENGGFLVVVNSQGHVVFSPKSAGDFRVLPRGEAKDLRALGSEDLAGVVNDSLQDACQARLVKMKDGEFYMAGFPMETVGWALLSVFDKEMAGKPAAMLKASYETIQQETSATYLEKMGHSRTTATVLVVAVAVLMLAGALILGKRIVRPLNTITHRIAELSETNLEFKMEDAYRTGDEIQVLAESFAALSHKTVEYVERVKTVTAEKERIGAELTLANQIQAAMLPHIVPAFPDRTDFDIFASMDPAKEVGGDFYDYFLVDEDHLCMVMADVSGKGVPAALFMMASKIMLQSFAMLGQSPSEILTHTNEAICSNNEAQMFVTVWLGILELSTGRLVAANAGHEYPVIKRPGGDFEVFKDRHGFVIGGMEGIRYKQYEMTLEPGCRLFLYTDGVTEATDENNQLFGMERMVDALNGALGGSPQAILSSVRRAVDRFVGSAPQFDDLTMLGMEYKGPQAGSTDKA